MPKQPLRLSATAFGQVASAELEFGDLTVLVGPQATGKSLLLQLLKLGLDFDGVRSTLERNGIPLPKKSGWKEFLALYFGEGMEGLWTVDTQVRVGSSAIEPQLLSQRRTNTHTDPTVLYVPAQRALAVPDGFPRSFRELGPDTPYAVREFSSRLHTTLLAPPAGDLFPSKGKLDEVLRKQLDRSVFHGGHLGIEQTGRKRYELTLTVGGEHVLPSMTWTAGQREFVPLLLSLYPLLPAGAVSRSQGTDWIIIEEPEMGLHPQAIVSTMYLVLELVRRGYRVVLSSHHPVVIDVLWAIRVLRNCDDSVRMLLKALGASQTLKSKELARRALQADVRVFALEYGADYVVTSTDISGLDPAASERLEQGWGGLTGYSTVIADAVAEAMGAT